MPNKYEAKKVCNILSLFSLYSVVRVVHGGLVTESALPLQLDGVDQLQRYRESCAMTCGGIQYSVLGVFRCPKLGSHAQQH